MRNPKQKPPRAGKEMMEASEGTKRAQRRLRLFAAVVRAAGIADDAVTGAAQAMDRILRETRDAQRAHAAYQAAELRKELARGAAEELARWNFPDASFLEDIQRRLLSTPPEIEAAIMSVCPSPKSRPKRKSRRKLGALTAKQKQAMELWTEYKGNYSEVGRAMGIDRKTAKQHVQAAFRKFGAEKANLILARVTPPKMQKLPEDRRGQTTLTKQDYYSYGGEADDELEGVLPDQVYVDDRGFKDEEDDEYD